VTDRPVPVPDDTSGPFWQAADEGRLAVAHCSVCHHAIHPPAPVCPACGATEPAYVFRAVSGRGVVRSWTVLRQAFLPGFADDLPVVLVDVALEGTDDLRLIGRLMYAPADGLRLGAAVEVAFEHLDDGSAIPAFALAPEGEAAT
jgi:uncharacterized OB-fold protein